MSLLETCPVCRTCNRVRQTGDAGGVSGFTCDGCHSRWAYSNVEATVVPIPALALLAELVATAGEISRLRLVLRQVADVAGELSTLTDEQLADRLTARSPSWHAPRTCPPKNPAGRRLSPEAAPVIAASAPVELPATGPQPA